MSTFAKNFKNLLAERNLTQSQFSRETGLDRNAIVHWTNGSRLPSARNLQKLSRLLGVTVDELMSPKDVPEVQVDNEPKRAGYLRLWLEHDLDAGCVKLKSSTTTNPEPYVEAIIFPDDCSIQTVGGNLAKIQ